MGRSEKGVGSFHDDLALCGPGFAEFVQRFGPQEALGHGENETFLEIELVPDDVSDAREKAGGISAGPGFADEAEAMIDGVVLVADGFELAELIEAGFEGHEQIILEFGVGFEGAFEESGAGLDLGQSFDGGQRFFEIIELRVKNGVFGDEGVSDFQG
jgi:hypothetical protein